MKIVHLSPGTGNFHCGNCLRDNALARELLALGHDVTIVPVYLPMVVDEPLAVDDGVPIFLGGINMYLQQKLPIFRHTPRWIDKWFDSRKLLLKAAKKAGMTRARDLGEMTLSTFRGEDGRQRKEVRRLVEWLKSTAKPDIVSLSNALLNGLAPAIKKELGVPVIALLQGEDSFLDSLPEPYKEQCWEAFRENNTAIDRYVPVSRYYGDLMRERMRLNAEDLDLVHIGVDPGLYRPPETPPKAEPPTIGYLARMCIGKGLHTLVDAFILLRERNRVPGVRLRVAGAQTDIDIPFIDAQKQKLEKAGLAGASEFLPNVSLEEKLDFLHSINVFSVPATYGEAFGLYLLEAMACGVPVVVPRHAAFPEIIGETGGGLLADPDDPESLALQLETVLTSPGEREKLGKAGRAGVEAGFNNRRMAEEFAKVCADVVGG